VITRFAPSPTGPLHLGHAYSAMLAHDLARAEGGTFLLRIEDIDRSRARPEWEAAIFDDLRWLGLDWPEPVMRQSDRLAAHGAALDRLWAQGLLYPCRCSRRDIAAALAAPQEGDTPIGPDGPVYPGTCRPAPGWRPQGPRPDGALRLNLVRARPSLGAQPLGRSEIAPDGTETPEIVDVAQLPDRVGDVVLARRDMGTSYHLGVVVDDAAQHVTDVVRGEDLFAATAIHVLLQRLLGLPTPRYHHHRLIRDETGRRLAKRDDARAIATYRTAGACPADIRCLVNLPPAP